MKNKKQLKALLELATWLSRKEGLRAGLFLQILTANEYQGAKQFLDAQGQGSGEFIYDVINGIKQLDSRKEHDDQRKRLARFFGKLQTDDPKMYAEIFHECCLRPLTNKEYADHSDFLGGCSFTVEYPSAILNGWVKELLLFLVRVGDDTEITDFVFNPEFSTRFMKRVAPELRMAIPSRPLEFEHLRDKKVTSVFEQELDMFNYLAQIVDFILDLHFKNSLLFLPKNDDAYETASVIVDVHDPAYRQAIEKLNECALFFCVVNQKQFLASISDKRFAENFATYWKYCTSEEGLHELHNKEWFKKMNGIQQLELKPTPAPTG